jgi:1,4-alpha-glucan branching enzyme
LSDNPDLKYSFLKRFDKAMNELEQRFHWTRLGSHQYVTMTHEADKLIVFEREDLVFIFNFHPHQSYEHYRIGTRFKTEHVILLDSDAAEFGGFNRLAPAKGVFFPVMREKWQNRENFIQLYIPHRTAIVLCAEENLAKYGLNINGRGAKEPTVNEVLAELKISE